MTRRITLGEMAPVQPTQDFSSAMTQLYFRLVVPLVAVIAGWGAYMEPPHDYRPVIPFCLSLLLTALLYPRVPSRWQWNIRVVLAAIHIVFTFLLVLVSPAMNWRLGPNSLYMMALAAPVTILSWNFLFFDRPRLGWALGLILSLNVTLLIWRWLLITSPKQSTLALLVFACSLLALQFGWSVAELQREAQRLRTDAHEDPLTGLPNRRAFESVCLSDSRPGTLAMLDIDHFKAVNDHYGHPAGDRVLRGVADVLLDLLPGGAQAFRWGGEEFVLLLPSRQPTEAQELLEQIRRELAGRTFAGGTRITLSGGVSTYASGQLAQAFAKADQALLSAKRTGRNRVVTVPGGAYTDPHDPRRAADLPA